MPIRPATKKKVATIELTSEDEEKIKQIEPSVFIGANEFPSGIRLAISADEALSDEAPDSVRGGGILETP